MAPDPREEFVFADDGFDRVRHVLDPAECAAIAEQLDATTAHHGAGTRRLLERHAA